MIDTLIADLSSPDPLVRVKAAPRLGDLGSAASEAIPVLLSLTHDEAQHPMIRVMAAGSVAKIDPAQTRALVPVLINALNSDDAPIQGAAADEPWALGGQVKLALPALFGLFTDDAPPFGLPATQAIWKITGDRTPAKLVVRYLLRSKDWLDRQVGGSLLVLSEDEGWRS
jgi:HEAT repeats